MILLKRLLPFLLILGLCLPHAAFAQTLRMMGLSKELVETNDFATKRDAYYQSKNWDAAKFDE